jgi:Yip1 domain
MKEIFRRAKQIIFKPKETWRAIKDEPGTVQELFINYAAPLALVPALATLIGLSIVGVKLPSGQMARAPFMEALTGGVLGYVFNLLGLLAAAWAVNFLSPYFESKSDFFSAVKLVVYAMTPIWLLGVLAVLPSLGLLQIFGLYSAYLIYTGLPIILETQPAQAAWYTTLIMIATIFISLVLSVVVGGAVYGPMLMRMMAV